MKFSWIVVFGLSALSIAIGAHALGIYRDAEISASQLAGMNEKMARMKARTSALLAEKDAIAARLEETSAKLDATQRELAEENQTHGPLRKQIENMTGSDAELVAEISRLNEATKALGKQLAAARKQATVAGARADRVKDLEAEANALRGKVSAAESVLASEQQSNAALVKDMAAGRDRIKQLEKELATTNRSKEELAKKLSVLEDRLSKDSAKAQ